MDIQREGLELVEERTGSPRIADATFWVGFIAFWATSLGAIAACIWATYAYIVPVLLDSARRTEAPASLWVTAGIFASLTLFSYFGFKRWERRFIRRLSKFLALRSESLATIETVDGQERRIKEIENRLGIGPRRRSELEALYTDFDPFKPTDQQNTDG